MSIMVDSLSTNPQSSATADPASQQSLDTIHYVCRALSALAWIAIIFWLLTPKGTRWANAAGDAGLAWILLTGGGYFAERTVRSFVNDWKASPTTRHEDTTCKNEADSPK
jgi:hypothetical protein